MKNFTSNTPPEEFNIPLLHKIFEFYKLAYEYIQLFPKKDKYTLGQKIDDLSLDFLELILSATQSLKEEKSKFLQKASIKLNILKIFVRLAKEIKVLDLKKYLILQEKLNGIGRMLGGWIKSIKTEE